MIKYCDINIAIFHRQLMKSCNSLLGNLIIINGMKRNYMKPLNENNNNL